MNVNGGLAAPTFTIAVAESINTTTTATHGVHPSAPRFHEWRVPIAPSISRIHIAARVENFREPSLKLPASRRALICCTRSRLTVYGNLILTRNCVADWHRLEKILCNICENNSNAILYRTN